MSLIEQHIIKFIAENQLIDGGEKLLIALSGGGDSVFALNFFNKFKQKYNVEIAAIHVNHSIRGNESDFDELFCKNVCRDLNIEFYSEKVDVPTIAEQSRLSLEEAARNIRYELYEKYLLISNADKIITAHNLDDNTETVLLNLFRGTGLKGISGIPVHRDKIIRPFLSVSKKDIIEYLSNQGIRFVIDSTNDQNKFKRNFLRNEIIPKIRVHINKAADRNVLHLSQIVKNTEDVISGLVEEKIKNLVSYTDYEVQISKEIKIENSFIKGEIIKKCVQQKFLVDFEFDNLQIIENLISQQVGNRVDLQDNLEAISERSILIIRKKKNASPKEFEKKLYFDTNVTLDNKTIGCEIVNRDEVVLTKRTNIEYIEADNLNEPLVLRKWLPSDRFQPIGLKGTKKVSDFLTDSKVLNIERENQLILLNGEKIIWLIDNRIDENVKVKENTKKVLKIWVK